MTFTHCRQARHVILPLRRRSATVFVWWVGSAPSREESLRSESLWPKDQDGAWSMWCFLREPSLRLPILRSQNGHVLGFARSVVDHGQQQHAAEDEERRGRPRGKLALEVTCGHKTLQG